MVNCINLIIEISPRFILGRENVPCVTEVVNRSLKADCTDYTSQDLALKKREKSSICRDIELKFGIGNNFGPLTSKQS